MGRQAARLHPSLLGTCALGKRLGHLLKRHRAIQTDGKVGRQPASPNPTKREGIRGQRGFRCFAKALQERPPKSPRRDACGFGPAKDAAKAVPGASQRTLVRVHSRGSAGRDAGNASRGHRGWEWAEGGSWVVFCSLSHLGRGDTAARQPAAHKEETI